MKTIGAAKFKEQCLSILDNLDREGTIITKHGKPIAKLIPIESSSENLIGSFKGKLIIKADIITTGVNWNAKS